MPNIITISELKTLIANCVKEKGLNDVLTPEVLEKIKNSVLTKYHHNKANTEIPELVPEAQVPGPGPAIQGGSIEFPKGDDANAMEFGADSVPNSGMVGMEAGSEPTGQEEKPNMGYIPELPSFIDKIEPGKVIIFSQNELSEGGENLANKPLRTFSDPDIKKSIHNLWVEEGKKRAEVYLAKLEKIGDLEFDYANGTAKFVEKRLEPEFPMIGTNKENVMVQEPEQKISDIPELALTAEGVLKKTIEDVLKEFKIIPTQENNFKIKMNDLVNEENGFIKTDTPSELLEAISKGDKSNVINENNEVREWKFSENHYFTPMNPLSLKKCYTNKK